MKKMTNEEARIVASIAQRLLTVAEKQDWHALKAILPTVEETTVFAKLGAFAGNTDLGEFEVLTDECDLETGELKLVIKNEITVQEIKSHTWENNETMYCVIETAITPTKKL